MPRQISQELLLSVIQQKMRSNENQAKFLARQTHLHLNGKGLSVIEALACCPGLKVLYLFDNEIEAIEGLNSCSQLTHLYLQHNSISQVGDVSQLRRLEKLYLDGNCLRSLAPLAPLAASLVELHASSQQLPEGQPLDLSPETLASMERLRVLAVANNNLTSTAPLAGLRTLEKVDLSKNGLEALSAVAPLLAASPILELDLRGNPITDSRQALDAVIVAGRGIAVLNGRELTAAERPYLEQLHRRGARSLEMLT